MAVTATGRGVGDREFGTASVGRWATSTFTVPADAVTGPELRVALGPRGPYLAPFPDYTAFSYWASQG